MNSHLTPPGHTDSVHAESALVVAPHFDDEVLGCGGLVAQLSAAGAAVRVLFLSDGSGGVEEVADREAYRQRRRSEAEASCEVLGVVGVDRLDLPDGALDHYLDTLADGVRRALVSQRPDLLLVTSPLETSRDHRAAFRGVHEALAGLAEGGREPEVFVGLQILAYEVNHPLYADLLVDVSAEWPTIEAAIICHQSQLERHDYLEACRGLRRYRVHSLPPGTRAVEAYRRLTFDDFSTRSPARLVADLGGAPELLRVEEGPRISVVVRTRDRPDLLRQALTSLAQGTYRRAEVIVVNDGGDPPEMPMNFPLPLRRIDLESNRGRAGAANAGIAAAENDWLTFLDDDDLADPEHLATLAGLTRCAGVRVAYTDAAVGVYEATESGWRCVERRRPYSRDFDPSWLLLDNYIPFNTLIIERQLLEETGDLDPELAFFEDWDLLIRLAARTRFHHLPRVTCEYRHFRGAGHHVLGDDSRRRADFITMKARVLAKHSELLTPELTAQVVDRLRAEAVAEREAARRLRGELAAAETRWHELNGRYTASEIRQRTLEEWRDRVQSDLHQQHAEHRRLDVELERLYRRESELASRERQLEEELVAQAAESRHWIAEWEARAAALERSARDTEARLEAELEAAHRAHGDTAERLRLMTEQEARVADELRRTYAEIERLGSVADRLERRIREMESTRAWRLHSWWQEHKSGGLG